MVKSMIQFNFFMLNSNLVSFAVILAALVPNLGPIISLVGALSSSTLALIFPPLIEIVTFGPERMGRYYWMLWKNLAIMLFGILGFFFGMNIYEYLLYIFIINLYLFQVHMHR